MSKEMVAILVEVTGESSLLSVTLGASVSLLYLR